MHYVRFLKPPKIHKDHSKHYLKFLFTIQTDLGDCTYPFDIDLDLSLYAKGVEDNGREVLSHKLSWKSTDRQVQVLVELKTWRAPPNDFAMISLRPQRRSRPRFVSSTLPGIPSKTRLAMPAVIGADSPFWQIGRTECSRAILRPIPMYIGDEMFIEEESSDSIARHTWDAGMAAVAVINAMTTFASRDKKDEAPILLPTLRRILRSGTAVKIVELGSGVGLVGCAFARFVSQAKVLLTDLPDAQSIAESNACRVVASDAARITSAPEFQSLDWTAPIPTDLTNAGVDLFVASDCTYNPDYSPHLVKVIDTLEAISPGAAVIIAGKERHESERVFFEKMQEARFVLAEHEIVLAPLDDSNEALQEAECIDIQIFKRL